MPRSESRVATSAADPVCSLGGACAVGRGGGCVAPVTRRSTSVRSRWRSAPGSRPWCRGGRPRKATSPTRSSNGTSVSPAACPARSWSRRPESATCAAGRCCASATTASCRGCGGWSKRCARASDGRTRLFIQLIDFLAIRRRPEPKKFFERFLAITDRHRAALGEPDLPDAEVRARLAAMSDDELARVLTPAEREALDFGYRERVTDMEHAHIRDLPQVLPQLFRRRRGAREQAGFDGVELHYAHAYTMASFLSRTNTRADGYGGSLENRVRLPLEVFAAVRARVGKGFRGRAAGSWRTNASTAAAASMTPFISASPSPAPAWIFFRPRAAASSTTPSSRPWAPPPIPIPAAAATSACRSSFPTSAGRSAATRSRPRRSAARCALPAATAPVVLTGGIHNFEMAEDLSRARRLRHRRRGAAIAGRSRLVQKNSPRPRRRGARVRIHQLLRGARPEAQAGHLPALGQARFDETASAARPTASGG